MTHDECFDELDGKVGTLVGILGAVEVGDDLGIALEGGFFFRAAGNRSSR